MLRLVLLVGTVLAALMIAGILIGSWQQVVRHPAQGSVLFAGLVLLGFNFFYLLTIPVNRTVGEWLARFVKAWKSASN